MNGINKFEMGLEKIQRRHSAFFKTNKTSIDDYFSVSLVYPIEISFTGDCPEDIKMEVDKLFNKHYILFQWEMLPFGGRSNYYLSALRF
jgi:hypothetical protein